MDENIKCDCDEGGEWFLISKEKSIQPCYACLGKKTISSLGMISHECPVCEGRGLQEILGKLMWVKITATITTKPTKDKET